MIPMKGGRLVQSVPGELNMDHTAVLQKAEVRDEAFSRYMNKTPHYSVELHTIYMYMYMVIINMYGTVLMFL